MAGLQRLITYIYKYENDEKKENAGFAKVEIRGTICRIEVHIRNINMEPSETTVYLFARNEDIMQGISVGNMVVSRGNGDVRYAFETKELLNFGKTMQEIEGMFIPFGDNAYLASNWKEGKIERRLFRIIEKQEKSPELKSSQMKSTTQENAESQSMQMESSQQEITEPQSMQMESPQQGITKPQSTQMESPQQGTTEPQATQMESLQQGSIEPQESQEPQPSQINTTEKESPRPQIPRNVYTTELPLENFREETTWNHLFQKLRLKLDIFFPFEGQEIECVRMQLNDLQELPKKYWYLGNNSFLLHGFFNYRHIILGQIVEEGRKEYFLGVPGVFQNQERIMAAMFGFPEFRTAKTTEYKTGNFGYWYRIL